MNHPNLKRIEVQSLTKKIPLGDYFLRQSNLLILDVSVNLSMNE